MCPTPASHVHDIQPSHPEQVESDSPETVGLGLLDIETHFSREKVTAQLTAIDLVSGAAISGYEIHYGRIVRVAEHHGDISVQPVAGYVAGAEFQRTAERALGANEIPLMEKADIAEYFVRIREIGVELQRAVGRFLSLGDQAGIVV